MIYDKHIINKDIGLFPNCFYIFVLTFPTHKLHDVIHQVILHMTCLANLTIYAYHKSLHYSQNNTLSEYKQSFQIHKPKTI